MASQNIPGIAVLNVNGYEPEPGPLFGWTGAFGLASAPFGGHAVNLAAITAALCADENAGPDPRKRYRAAAIGGGAYVLLGLGAGAAVAFVGAAPPTLIEAVAGLALLGALGNSLVGAVTDPGDREAAVVTLVVTVSGCSSSGSAARSGGCWPGARCTRRSGDCRRSETGPGGEGRASLPEEMGLDRLVVLLERELLRTKAVFLVGAGRQTYLDLAIDFQVLVLHLIGQLPVLLPLLDVAFPHRSLGTMRRSFTSVRVGPSG